MSWVKDVQRSEELVASALKLADGREIQRQSIQLSHLLGRAQDALSALDDSDKMQCVAAAQALFNPTLDVKLTAAQAATAAVRDAKTFNEAMRPCERTVGVPSRRTLSIR